MIRREISPAVMGSVLLHGLVAAALMLSWTFTRDLKVGSVVPVTIVANGPEASPAIQAPAPQTAQAEQPVPEAPLESVPPAPEPKPTPPAPMPKPTPAPTPAKPAPPTKPEKSLDLDALAASLSKTAKPSSAAKGPARPETAVEARPNPGAGLAASVAMSGLVRELERRWNPNCDVEGGRDVQVLATFVIGAGGQVVGDVQSKIKSAPNAVSQAAAERAVRAVYAAAPFRTLPREFYGQKIGVNFDARAACS